MKPLIVDNLNKSKESLYIQIYNEIKKQILNGQMKYNDKLPSIRSLALDLKVSVMTIKQSYEQLLTEGYITSLERSGYYVADLPKNIINEEEINNFNLEIDNSKLFITENIVDESIFEFTKWKKCTNKVINDFPKLLMFESDIQGELPLRFEISKYVFSSRGVKCSPENIVIGAGTQQLMNYLCKILNIKGISHLSTEDPGYLPIQYIFRDHNFSISKIPVDNEGILIDRLPNNITSAVYVCPSNQFPTGAVMPIANRYKILEWAEKNNSYILEDDYDSELRYFGQPIPALQGLDKFNRVIYLGSFSSTVFPALKISYMILPDELSKIFEKIKNDYNQTCSKTEQLTLALFMKNGYYKSNIKKLRNLYSQKLNRLLNIINENAKDLIIPYNSKSGLNIILTINSSKDKEYILKTASELGLKIRTLDDISNNYVLNYNQIPLDNMDKIIDDFINKIK